MKLNFRALMIILIILAGAEWIYIGFNYLSQPTEQIKKSEVAFVMPVDILEDATPIEEIHAIPRPQAPDPIHSNDSWLYAEEIANGDSSALAFVKETAPTDTMIARYRELTYNQRIKMIKNSRVRYLRPQSAWGDLITDTLGVKPGSVLVFSKGLCIAAREGYYFFHRATIEQDLKMLSTQNKIAIRLGTDGHCYPAIRDKNGRNIPLTYWGEIN